MRTYRSAHGIIVDQIGNEVAITIATGDVLALNQTAAVVFNAIAEGGNEQKAWAALIAECRADPLIAAHDARRCMAKLRAFGAIQLVSDREKPEVQRHFPLITRRGFAAGALASALSAVFLSQEAWGNQSTQASFGCWSGEERGGWRLWDDPRGFKLRLPTEIKKVAPVGALSHSMMETIDSSMIVRASNWGMRATTSADREEVSADLSEISGMCVCQYIVEDECPDIILSIIPKENPLSQNEVLAVNESGVPIVHMVVGAEDIPDAYETLGQLLGTPRATEIADYLRGLNALLEHDRNSIPAETRKLLYIGTGKNGTEIKGDSLLLGKAISLAGARSIEGFVDQSASLSPAVIRDLSPDLAILCPCGEAFERTYSSDAHYLWLDEELAGLCPVLAEPTEPYGWLDRSPLVISTIGAAWLGAMAHPTECSYDITELSTEFWSFMFGVELPPEDMLPTVEAAEQAFAQTASVATSPFPAEEELRADQAELPSEEDATAETSDAYVSPNVEVISAQAIAATATRMSSYGGGGGGNDGGGGGAAIVTPSNETLFKNALQNHFGFSSDIANLINSALAGCKTFCSSLNSNRNLTIAYVFFRTIGGFVYGDIDLDDQLRWDAVAGSASGIYNSSILGTTYSASTSEETFFVSKLGLSKAQYEKLRYYVRLQHLLSGVTLTQAVASFDNDSGYYANAKANYLEGHSLSSIADATFINTWHSLANKMCVMPDFCHFCITTATHLASSLNLATAGNAAVTALFPLACETIGDANTARESFAGWLGDAVLAEGTAGPTFGWDDYWSDIDALKIAKRLSADSYDVRKAFANYYYTSTTNFTRRNYFTTYFTADKAAKAIGSCLYTDLRNPVTSADDLISRLSSNTRYTSTVRFVKAIKGTVSEGQYGGASL